MIDYTGNLAEKKIIPHCSFVQRFPDCSVKTCLSPWGWLSHLTSSALPAPNFVPYCWEGFSKSSIKDISPIVRFLFWVQDVCKMSSWAAAQCYPASPQHSLPSGLPFRSSSSVPGLAKGRERPAQFILLSRRFFSQVQPASAPCWRQWQMTGLLIANTVSIILSFKVIAVVSCEQMLLFHKTAQVRCCKMLPFYPPSLGIPLCFLR